MKTQQEFIEQIAALIKENPALKVRFMVVSDEVSEDHSHTSHLIERVELNIIYEGNEGYAIGQREIEDYLMDDFVTDGMSQNEAERTIKEVISHLDLEIFVYTGAGP